MLITIISHEYDIRNWLVLWLLFKLCTMWHYAQCGVVKDKYKIQLFVKVSSLEITTLYVPPDEYIIHILIFVIIFS